MIDSFIYLVTEQGNRVWVTFCVIALILGFFFCFGNLRRQILIISMVCFWGTSIMFYEDFYMMPIARYAWFPYWVLIEALLILTIFYAQPLTKYFSRLLNIDCRTICDLELKQELVVSLIFLVVIFTDIAQLASILSGTGGVTAFYYDTVNRLLLSITVMILISPGKNALLALKDSFNEKFGFLVGNGRSSNRSFNRFKL